MVPTTRTTAVIGAGIAGLACARRLVAAGHAVRLFDKGRTAGGRVATRRTEEAGAFDHGAAFFTVRDPGFAAAIAPLRAAGQVATWMRHDGEERLVGVPGMSALPRALAAGLDVVPATRIRSLGHTPAGWALVDEAGGQHGPFGAVVVALPGPQAVALLGPLAPELAARAARATYAPCWTVLAAWPVPLPTASDVYDHADPAMGWAAREPARPGRAGGERWVLHGAPAWSTDHLEDDPADVAAALLAAFARAVGTPLPPPAFVKAHRWRHARVTRPLGEGCLAAPGGLVACGDWCLGPRIEAAWLSGVAAAERVLAGEASRAEA